MPLILFNGRQSSALRLLQSLSEETAAEFCRMSIDGLSKPVTRKALSAAAASLSCTPEEIKMCLDAVSLFFLDAAKLQLRDGDVVDSLAAVPVPPAIATVLNGALSSERQRLCSIARQMSLSCPELHSVRWRLETVIFTRCAGAVVIPRVRLEIRTSDGKVHCLELDVSTLRQITMRLKLALQDGSGFHMRRVQRFIK